MKSATDFFRVGWAYVCLDCVVSLEVEPDAGPFPVHLDEEPHGLCCEGCSRPFVPPTVEPSGSRAYVVTRRCGHHDRLTLFAPPDADAEAAVPCESCAAARARCQSDLPRSIVRRFAAVAEERW